MTVASLIVKGRQDERRDAAEAIRREEERRLAIEREDQLRETDMARDLYVRVFERVRELARALDRLEDYLDDQDQAGETPSPEWVSEWRVAASAANAEVESIVPTLVMSSRSVEVLQLVDVIADSAAYALYMTEVEVNQPTLAISEVSRARGAFRGLAAACRADLDLARQAPPRESAQQSS